MDAKKEMSILQILILRGEDCGLHSGTLLNQIPFDGTRREAEIWVEDYRTECLCTGTYTNFDVRYITD